jgi:hypothetical protein
LNSDVKPWSAYGTADSAHVNKAARGARQSNKRHETGSTARPAPASKNICDFSQLQRARRRHEIHAARWAPAPRQAAARAPARVHFDAPLEHVPKKLTDYFDKNLLRQFDPARFPVDRMVTCDRKAR